MTIGESKQFNYTGNVQQITLTPGIYQFECYGAGSKRFVWTRNK